MKAILALEDGTWFEGESFTGPGETGGEAIFNTGMTGYQEILTDPSYTGQMVCMTYPLIGNYGITEEDIESDKIHVSGFIVKECCKKPSNWRSVMPLHEYLQKAGVMGIEGIDTRALTRHLRVNGAMRGIISTEELDPVKLAAKAAALPTMEGCNLADQVSPDTAYTWKDSKPCPIDVTGGFKWTSDRPHLVVIDYGTKWNILRLLDEQGFEIVGVPSSFSEKQIRDLEPDALFLSNGPGDPAVLTHAVETAKALCQDYPTAGICLGHQILGQALGGKAFKLKFGHHGCNHPVMDMETEKIEISSQNHGFCVDISGCSDLVMTHKNLNDETLEGFAHKSKPIIAIQFHPEAAPGPHDSCYFFSRFRDMVKDQIGK
ncbi:glutamine-hydrolyzing carbamoyl-phosphate synthase small subunit [Maridesulfovibrio bastinii]|uniref:glutamine-hydrolyzing carbamoyl-phosphate synthase small subunit n=1 Tax=Maridesulfovibrio bastinii TaxID=47157 RepID=UPI000418ED7B|nr:glutamine-hydrolyzing carbamoyl-phosphate synthase small subunit [Maridesulfovibrio bastinii]